MGNAASTQAQGTFFENRWMQIEAQHGFILPEYSNLNYLVQKPVQSLNLSLWKPASGTSYWEAVWGYPDFGVNLFYTTLGNDSINGREWALYPFVRFHILQKKRWGIFQQMGIGAGYVTRKFDLNDNYLNITTGSHLNIHFNFRVGVQVQLNSRMQWRASLNFDHFSNGNSREPNLGLNSICASTGLAVRLGASRSRGVPEFPPHEKKQRLEVTARIGGKRARALVSEYFYTGSLSLEWLRSSFRAVHFGVGADAFFDSSTEAEMKAANSGPYKPIYDFQTGIHLTQAFIYNRVQVSLQEGLYLGLRYRVKPHPIYTRLAVTYRITDHVAVNMAMKSHLHVLDYPEIGFGYRW